VTNSRGLTIQRRDGKYYVRFVYDSRYIEIGWYQEGLGWNYYPLDIFINKYYDYKYFHIVDPHNPEYYQEGNVETFAGLVKFDLYKLYEKVKWNRTGQILHVTYVIAAAENVRLAEAVNNMLNAFNFDRKLYLSGLIDPAMSTILSVTGIARFFASEYDMFMAAS
jgi:hypothetical protein